MLVKNKNIAIMFAFEFFFFFIIRLALAFSCLKAGTFSAERVSDKFPLSICTFFNGVFTNIVKLTVLSGVCF